MEARGGSDRDSPLLSGWGDGGGKAEDVFASEESLEPRVLTMAVASIRSGGRSGLPRGEMRV